MKLTSVKLLTLTLCVGTLTVVAGLTGCASTGSRYEQSTGEHIDDNKLASNVEKALAADTQYKYGDVKVVAFKGVVQLNGFVNTKDQKERAGDLAKTADGVKEIANNVTVKE
jgi:hyperosmotically inducible periplasmic protein